MSLQEFAVKVEWEGGIAGALEYGLKHTDLDPADPDAAELATHWKALEEVYRDHGARAEEILEAVMDDE